MTTNPSPPAEFTEPTPTNDSVEMTHSEYETLRRAAVAVLINLHYAKFGRIPGYKAKVKIELVEKKE